MMEVATFFNHESACRYGFACKYHCIRSCTRGNRCALNKSQVAMVVTERERPKFIWAYVELQMGTASIRAFDDAGTGLATS